MATDSYLPGTIVLLSSFLAHNPWFDGDLVVVDDGLSPAGAAALARFPRLRLEPIDARLDARLADLITSGVLPPAKRTVLCSLASFGLPGYRRVLKLDSDIVCTGNAAELFTRAEPLVCAFDQAHFRHEIRDLATYAARASGSPAVDPAPTFNAGMMLIDLSRLPRDTFARLLDAVSPSTWAGVRTGHSDSVLLNRYFRGAWTPVDERYNYFISARMGAFTRPRVPLDRAVFVHLLGRPKPWHHDARAAADLAGVRQQAFALWDDAWRHALTAGFTPE